MRVLRSFLIFGWVILLGTVLLCFIFPKPMGHMLEHVADFFVLVPAALLIGTALYGIIHLYRAGMRRSDH
jgi:hypothetical protein